MHTFNCNYSAPFVYSRKSHLATVKKISKREEKDKMVLCTLQCFCWKGKEWEKMCFMILLQSHYIAAYQQIRG